MHPNQVEVLETRILARDADGNITESIDEMWHRVAGALANTESEHADFYRVMSSLHFLPNSPCLVNAGRKFGQMSACFVIPVPDSIEGIFEAVKVAAIIHKTGGGTGFDFSSLRPAGSLVASTGNFSSGPASFIDVFDAATASIKQGGVRRGANMGILDIGHKDIREFIGAKRHYTVDGVVRRPEVADGFVARPRRWTNFNVSVAVDDAFLSRLQAGRDDAVSLWRDIAEAAWDTGDPGLFFIDRVNRAHANPNLGRITSTNPCGEVPLLPWESCTLGSINVAAFVRGEHYDDEALAETARVATRFLNRVLDKNIYPDPRVRDSVLRTRKIGVGIMGLADALALLGLHYDSDGGRDFAEHVAYVIDQACYEESVRLAEREGPFPNFTYSTYSDGPAIRNSSRTVIAPTGTLATIADCSHGIEPVFAREYDRHIMDTTLRVRHPLLDKVGAELLPTANEVSPLAHLLMQQALQRYVNDSISKTVNMPYESTVEDMLYVYNLATVLDIKGLTVFRDGCLLTGQVMEAVSGNDGQCPSCDGANLAYSEGCTTCLDCNYAACDV